MKQRTYSIKPVSNGFVVENDGNGLEVVQGRESELLKHIGSKAENLIFDELIAGSKDEFKITITFEKC